MENILQFFLACPVSMKLQLSIVPRLPASEGVDWQDDGNILLLNTDGKGKTIVAGAGVGGIFGQIVEKMVAKKKRH